MKKLLMNGSSAIAFAAADSRGGAMETKDDSKSNAAPKTANGTEKAMKEFMGAWEEFKTSNDARISELEKKGASDPLLDEKLDKINRTLDQHEKFSESAALLEKQQQAMAELQKNFDQLETAVRRSGRGDAGTDTKARAELWSRAVYSAISRSERDLPEEELKVINDVREEFKALSVSTDTAGGYLAPMEYVMEIIKAVTEISPVRSLARVRQTSQKTVQIPKRTGQFAAQWVAEQGSKSETTGLSYGLQEIPTHELYALIDISNQMFEDSAFNMNAEISAESAEQFALAEGTSFVNGSGVGQPEGFMTNSDVATTNTGAATAVTADGLLALKHAIKTAYTANAFFLMNRTTLGSVRKLKDSNGQYLWIPGIAAGKPNTIDGDPYLEVPDMPNEGAGLKPVAYGDFRRAYTWVDRIQMEMLRDPYTQATSGNVRFVMRKRVGGQVVLAEAIRTNICST